VVRNIFKNKLFNAPHISSGSRGGMFHTALEIDAKDILTGTVDGGANHIEYAKFYIKERYLLMKHMVSFFIQADQTIFGGYVRDMLVNNYWAQNYYANGGTSDLFTERNNLPDSYEGRMTMPTDIDIFTEDIEEFNQILEKLCKNNHKMSGLFVSSQKTIHSYCHHPLFSTNFKVVRYVMSYKCHTSFQSSGHTILMNIDVVTRREFGVYGYPWECMCECVSNLMYLNKNGVQIGTIGRNTTQIEKTLQFARIIELTLAKKTYISFPSYEFRAPSDAVEKRSIALNFADSENFNQSQLKLRYREKFFERLIKMFKKGYKILNSPLILHEWSDDHDSNMNFTNRERFCCISHEDFSKGEIVVRFVESKSVMKEKVFYDYIRQTPVDAARYASLTSGDWSLTCPVSGKTTNSFLIHAH
tara:strand:- start:269 stop:1516 length:1248 start_codon:yes stop_codon:yes gene_type:complete